MNDQSTSGSHFLPGSEAAASAWERLLADPASSQDSDYRWSSDIDMATADSACPETSVWASLASERISATEREALLAHAALCASCAACLRQTTSILVNALSEEEEHFQQQLYTLTDSGRHQLAVQLANSLPAPRRPFSGFFFQLAAAVAALLMVAVGAGIWWHQRSSAERMLAEVYSQNRCYELRLPGSRYAEINPLQHLRGNASPQSALLQQARQKIESHLRNSPSDAYWLRQEARVDLLEENFDPAVAILDNLVQAHSDDAQLLADDAAAHYQRGEITGSASDLAIGLTHLRRADELQPGDPVILFNEAIVMEDHGEWMNAVETWNRFLHFEHDPQWQKEGRQRLSALQNRIQSGKTLPAH